MWRRTVRCPNAYSGLAAGASAAIGNFRSGSPEGISDAAGRGSRQRMGIRQRPSGGDHAANRRERSRLFLMKNAGRLRIGDDWNAITIIALSQQNPLKAVAE